MKHRIVSRLAALFLAAGLALGLFGCAPTEGAQTASDPATAVETQTPEASSDDTAQEPSSSASQPVAQEENAEPAEEEKQEVKEQLADIQEQAAQLEASSTAGGNSEAQEALNQVADELDAYLQEEVEGSGN